jgi:hypothetical protein
MISNTKLICNFIFTAILKMRCYLTKRITIIQKFIIDKQYNKLIIR